MGRLGAHVQDWTPGTLDAVLAMGGRILKTMSWNPDPVRDVLDHYPDTVIVIRKYFDDGEQRGFMEQREIGGRLVANLVYDEFAAIIALCRDRGATLYVEGLNEIGLWNDADDYNAFTVGFAQGCQDRRVRPAAYCFATGNPPGYRDGSPDDLRAYWAHYLPGLYATKAAGGALALHEYDAPTMQRLAGWLCLRYRRVYDILPADLKDLPLLITETGIDGGVIGAGSASAAGWKNYASGEDYAADLIWYDIELAKDPQVIGATIFTAGSTGMWDSFEIKDCQPVIDAVFSRRDVLAPLPPEPPPPDPGYDHIRVTAQNVANILTQLNVIWALGNAEVKAAVVAIKDHINESPVYG